MPDNPDTAIRIVSRETVWKRFIHLEKVVMEQRMPDGRTVRLDREVHDHGRAAAILLVDPKRQSVVLVRQFRIAASFDGHPGWMVEVPAGLLDGDNPADAIAREVMEETGYRVTGARHLFDAYASPGTLTERIAFFVAGIDATDRAAAGGGLAEEGEDIEVLEIGIDAAHAMIASGEICDAKTIILLQWLMLNRTGFEAPHAG